MKLHIITVGAPKLAYAQAGWHEYIGRLKHYHTVRITHIADRNNDPTHLLQAAGTAYKIALVIKGKQMTSPGLSQFLDKRAQDGREVCLLIGGPDGLPKEVIEDSDFQWSFSELTFPHDLAMVILAESLYRASTISANLPYHK
jgi:23S rRNA (pseudouridine1915-N3)-methyltransferase